MFSQDYSWLMLSHIVLVMEDLKEFLSDTFEKEIRVRVKSY